MARKEVVTTAPRAARILFARKTSILLAPPATVLLVLNVICGNGGVDQFGLIPVWVSAAWSYCIFHGASFRPSRTHDKSLDDGEDESVAREQRRSFVKGALVMLGDIAAAAGFFSFFVIQCVLAPGFVGVWASIGILTSCMCYASIAFTEFLDLMSSIDFPLRRCEDCKNCPRCGKSKGITLREDEEARVESRMPLSVSAEEG